MRLLLILTLFFSISCSKDTAKQITADMLAPAISTAIIVTLDCAEKTVVANDVKAEVYRWFQLKDNKGIVRDMCKTVVAEIIPELFGTTMDTIKPEWKCTVNKLENASQVLSEAACNNLN